MLVTLVSSQNWLCSSKPGGQPFIDGARSVVYRACRKTDPRSVWIADKQRRLGTTKACVAVANKNARIVWSLIASGDHTADLGKFTAALNVRHDKPGPWERRWLRQLAKRTRVSHFSTAPTTTCSYEMLEPPEMAQVAEISFFRT